MAAPFRISTTSSFDRQVRDLHRGGMKLVQTIFQLKAVLQEDPCNRSHRHHIKKLKDVRVGEGQYRIRSGKYRLRYDIIGNDVILYSFKHRSEAY